MKHEALERGGKGGRQLKAAAHLLRLPCQVKEEEEAMNIKPEVCVHHVPACVWGRERGKSQQTVGRKRERRTWKWKFWLHLPQLLKVGAKQTQSSQGTHIWTH